MRLFIVEDEKEICDTVAKSLYDAGYEVDTCYDGEEALAGILTENYDLVVLDLNLPGMDGMEILKKLKTSGRTKDIPVIMASAKGTEYDKVIGLDLGADDYLAKPFGMMEMVSRVKAVLRRTKPDPEQMVLQAGDLELDLGAHIVKVHGQRVQLTLKEYELLRLFMENINRVFTREQLLSNIWESDYFGETRTVDVHVGTLRTKLQDCGSYIRTVRGVGYRMEIPQ